MAGVAREAPRLLVRHLAGLREEAHRPSLAAPTTTPSKKRSASAGSTACCIPSTTRSTNRSSRRARRRALWSASNKKRVETLDHQRPDDACRDEAIELAKETGCWDATAHRVDAHDAAGAEEGTERERRREEELADLHGEPAEAVPPWWRRQDRRDAGAGAIARVIASCRPASIVRRSAVKDRLLAHKRHHPLDDVADRHLRWCRSAPHPARASAATPLRVVSDLSRAWIAAATAACPPACPCAPDRWRAAWRALPPTHPGRSSRPHSGTPRSRCHGLP